MLVTRVLQVSTLKTLSLSLFCVLDKAHMCCYFSMKLETYSMLQNNEVNLEHGGCDGNSG